MNPAIAAQKAKGHISKKWCYFWGNFQEQIIFFVDFFMFGKKEERLFVVNHKMISNEVKPCLIIIFYGFAKVFILRYVFWPEQHHILTSAIFTFLAIIGVTPQKTP